MGSVHCEQPRERLLNIPHRALLNKSTIAHLYAPKLVASLSATQLLCIHLCRFRDAEHDASTSDDNEAFIPYLRSLPISFETVPLWCQVTKGALWQKLVEQDLLPMGLRAKVEDVKERFDRDWKAVNEVNCFSQSFEL